MPGANAKAVVVIGEVDADQVSTDVAEFVELYDGGAGNTSLNDLALVFFDGADDASYLAFDLDGQSTNANGYFVLCGNSANVVNCDLDISPNTNLIDNGAAAVALYEDDGANFPSDTPLTTVSLLDALVYGTNDAEDAEDAGLLVLLNAGQPQVNEDGGIDSIVDSNQRCGGGARDTNGYVQASPTPGAANDCSSYTSPVPIPAAAPLPDRWPWHPRTAWLEKEASGLRHHFKIRRVREAVAL